MGKIIIEIEDRLYNDFLNWSNANNMSENDMKKYIIRAFRNQFMIDKFGDLNDKFTEKQVKQSNPVTNVLNKVKQEVTNTITTDVLPVQPVPDIEKPIIQTEEPIKKPGRPRKKIIQSR